MDLDGDSDMSGHRVQFADLPPNDHKGSPKFHSKEIYRTLICVDLDKCMRRNF